MKYFTKIRAILLLVFVLVLVALRKTTNLFSGNDYILIVLLALALFLLGRLLSRWFGYLLLKYQNKIEGKAEGQKASDALEEEKDAFWQERETEEQESKTRKRRKEVLLVAVILLVGTGIRVGSQAFLEKHLLDGYDSTEELFAEVERMRQEEADWEAYRQEERAAGGPLYRVEDVFPERTKPEHWETFYVLTLLPEGFYYKDNNFQSRSPGDWTVTQIFAQTDAPEKVLYLVQSQDSNFIESHTPKGLETEEGRLYQEERGTRNQIFWYKGDIMLCLEGNLPMTALEEIAQGAVEYQTVQMDYSAIGGLEE